MIRRGGMVSGDAQTDHSQELPLFFAAQKQQRQAVALPRRNPRVLQQFFQFLAMRTTDGLEPLATLTKADRERRPRQCLATQACADDVL